MHSAFSEDLAGMQIGGWQSHTIPKTPLHIKHSLARHTIPLHAVQVVSDMRPFAHTQSGCKCV